MDWPCNVVGTIMKRMEARLMRQGLRALVFALMLPLAFSAGLPALARVLHGPATHVCHCEARGGHTSCACPVCHPDDSELAFSDEAIPRSLRR